MARKFKQFYNMARYSGDSRNWGTQGGISFSTQITAMKNGREKRLPVLSEGLASFEIGNKDILEKDFNTIFNFFQLMEGKAYGFRIRDWTDYKDDGIGILLPTETNSLTFQMYKKRGIEYVEDYYLQTIRRPIGPSFTNIPGLGNTIKFFWNDRQIAQSNSSLSFTLDDKKGLATFNTFTLISSGISSNVATITSNPNLKIGDGIYFTYDSKIVYGLITNITNTSITFTTSDSQVYNISSSIELHPYPTENSSIRWTGYFDKPVRFNTDEFPTTTKLFIEKGEGLDPDVGITLPSIQLKEIIPDPDLDE